MSRLKTFIVLSAIAAVGCLYFSCVSGGSPKATEPLVLADFEKGEASGAFGSSWVAIDDTDPTNHGNSKAAVSMTDGADGSKYAVRLDYEHGPAYMYRFGLLKCDFPKVVDFSPYQALSFKIKGSGNKLKVHIGTSDISDFDYHEKVIYSTPADWTEIVMTFTSFQQEGWGKSKPFIASHVLLLQFQTGSQIAGEKGFITIDDVKLLPSVK